jgi:hypothetical protein
MALSISGVKGRETLKGKKLDCFTLSRNTSGSPVIVGILTATTTHVKRFREISTATFK